MSRFSLPSDEGFSLKSCLSTVGGLIGIITGFITIIKFFFSDADTFFTALEAFWLNTFLGKIWPEVGSGLGAISHTLKSFAVSSPFTPWWTAFLVFLIGGIASSVIHFFVFEGEFHPLEVPIIAIPALLWIWVFYGTLPIWGITLFIVVYIISVIGLPILADNFL